MEQILWFGAASCDPGGCSFAQDTLAFHPVKVHLLRAISARVAVPHGIFPSARALPARFEEASAVPADFATCRYGFFCREELKMEKATKLPIRIRLGSLQQCDYYEGRH